MLLQLRYPRFWLSLGWMFVVIALLVCLVPSGVPGLANVNDKFMHTLGYLALTVWFTGIYPRARYVLIAALLFAMGVTVEFLQGFMHVGRESDVRDVVANAGGIAAGMMLALAFLGGWTQRIESWIVPRA